MSAPFSDFRPISRRQLQALVGRLLLHRLNRHPRQAPHLLLREEAGKVAAAH
jgi:hypothetical protein